ncbi:hypothetical protein I7I51_06554 [Histoplasma capsulatum]|uniref:Uncharacterized protein n=1 Tax=Ajellomyces capsulatus TaxID=5037 RepID=A0A8A1MGW1_AJECA|nr:hypothetical protein I7I51_06554 [Histoplasma capsulatum]
MDAKGALVLATNIVVIRIIIISSSSSSSSSSSNNSGLPRASVVPGGFLRFLRFCEPRETSRAMDAATCNTCQGKTEFQKLLDAERGRSRKVETSWREGGERTRNFVNMGWW